MEGNQDLHEREAFHPLRRRICQPYPFLSIDFEYWTTYHQEFGNDELLAILHELESSRIHQRFLYERHGSM